VEGRFRNRVLLAEANQWPEEAAAYFGEGDECQMAFHFPLMPRLFMAIRMEDRFPVIDILQQTPPIPESSQWALFLRNHDELTLEMVTDEDRDYMYRSYAHDPRARINLGIRHRLAPLLSNDRRRIELMKGLLFSLPGTPVIYYGDEIGMGDNIFLGDRNGVRTPMQWSGDRNAGFSRANPQRLFLPVVIDPEYHYEAVNVENQQNNPQSFLWWMKRLIALRRRHRAFGHGSIEFLYPDNRGVLAFLRRHQEETILMVANLSRFVQFVELDLSRFQGSSPVELSGRTPFPPIGEQPYILTLSPYAFLWFSLESPAVVARPLTGMVDVGPPVLTVRGGWEHVFQGRARASLQRLLPAYLADRRWFGGSARSVVDTEIVEALPVQAEGAPVYLTLVQVEYAEHEAETYLIPLGFARPDQWEELQERRPNAFVARVRVREPSSGEPSVGLLYDASGEPTLSAFLFNAVRRRRRVKGRGGEAFGTPTRSLREMLPSDPLPEPGPLRVEQTNTTVAYGDRFVLKVYRRIESGVNPELEMARFLTDADFNHMPALAGAVEYRRGERTEPATLALLQQYVHNEGSAWQYALDALDRYYDRVLAERMDGAADRTLPWGSFLRGGSLALPEPVEEELGTFLPAVQLLAQRTAELHLALASQPGDPVFAPEAFPRDHQRSLFQATRMLLRRNLDQLRRATRALPAGPAHDATRLLEQEDVLSQGITGILDGYIMAQRIRVHGDYHLGQLLFTGRDFVVIDFEGEPTRPISERRLKRSPLTDVAGMLRSLHYAPAAALLRGHVRTDDMPQLGFWAQAWQYVTGEAFVEAYLQAMGTSDLLPPRRRDSRRLLLLFLVEKATQELGQELDDRQRWTDIPVQGLLQLADAYGEEKA
jgi:maltose alpha-D-glucosyltransferase/alpha-amylase